MKGTAKGLTDKAEADFSTATRELKAPESPNFDAVCFHAQQYHHPTPRTLARVTGAFRLRIRWWVNLRL